MRRVVQEGVVPAGAGVLRVEERIGEVLGIGIVGIPVGEEEVGLALPHGGPGARGVTLDDLHLDADGREALLHRLRDAGVLGPLRAPELERQSPFGVARLRQQRARTVGVVGEGARVES